MLLHRGLSSDCDVVNTGIIGIDKSNLYKLEYFNQFDQDMVTMTQLKFDHSMFPKKIVDYFEKYYVYLTKISLNSFIKSVIDHKF